MIDATPAFRLTTALRRRRLRRLDPVESQRRTLFQLLRRAAGTRFGRDHGFGHIADIAAFQAAVPLRRYEEMWRDYWQPAFPIIEDVSWPGRIPFFAVSSGTTSGRSKYIPVTDAMRRSNVRGGFDLTAWHLGARPRSRMFGGRSLMLGGSTALTEEAPGVFSGDLSGIAARTLPPWARRFVFPGPDLALLTDWEEKLDRIARGSLELPIRSVSGTTSWLLIFLERVRQLRRARGDAPDPPYPSLDLLVPGGVALAPYRPRLEQTIAGTAAEIREVYAASEGFIAVQDGGVGEGLRLNLDHGLFLEFVPVEELGSPRPTRHWIADAEPGVNYAVVLTSCAGLWAYVLGDTVRLVGRDPPRVLITGRTSYGLSAFGEHLIAEEVERAIADAAAATGADIADFAVTAVFPDEATPVGRHRWLVEFAAPPGPNAAARFAAMLDARLSALNDDYAAHRAGGTGMGPPEVVAVPPGRFAAWMKSRGRLGGQNKVPRLIADPGLAAELAAFMSGS
ncbi:GH3 family acyl-acid amido synthetase [Inquilinus limosus]|mgnify:CR=1 FL=1|uniref:Auxin-regulated protein n=1 Tax=Inquilinus limosus MP06 TaxID=1398085 RepID=A0A0A0DBM8_9PROT|nr:GH3 auxin-responsive promoter family protein [Inquilinus limosus]KGM35415.1 auxin-regulated protein [Inquilinus limosus MP06]